MLSNYFKISMATLCGATALFASITENAPVTAATIASQNFNSVSDGSTQTFDQLTTGSQLTNGSSMNANGALGMTFVTTWNDTRGETLGPVTQTSDSNDFIGVNSFAGSNSPDVSPNGTSVSSGSEHNYEFNDGDGRLDLEFDAVDVSGFTNIALSLNYWINDTGFESDDAFTVTLSDGITTLPLLSFGEPELEGNASADDGTANWNTLLVDISALGLGNSLSLTISADTNSSTENIFVDDVVFTGAVVPEPSSLALLSMGALGLIAGVIRRRKSATRS